MPNVQRVFNRQNIVTIILMGIIIIMGGVLRLSNIDWDGGYQLHPDERGMLFIAEKISFPDKMNPYRTDDGQLRSYAYGHLPLYLTVFVGQLTGADAISRYEHLTRVGRVLSGLYDTATILVAGLLAYRLYDRLEAMIIAAGSGAFAVLHIQNAHFGTVDSSLALWATLCIYWLVGYGQSKRRRDSILAGVCLGLAVGSKVTGLFLLLPIMAAFAPRNKSREGWGVRSMLTCLLVGFTVFAITNPYALLDPIPFLTETYTQAGVTSRIFDWPFTRQYIRTAPFIYAISQQARWTLGLPLTAAIYTSLIWMIIKAANLPLSPLTGGTDAISPEGASAQGGEITAYLNLPYLLPSNRPSLIALTWALIMVLFTGMQAVKFPRYWLPLMPTLFAFVGGMLSAGWSKRRWRYLVTASVLIPTAIYALAFINMYQKPHTWVEASEWLYLNLPEGSTIIGERWDDPLPMDMVVEDKGYLRERYFDSVLVDPFAEPDDTQKLDNLLREVSRADAIIFSSNRLYGSIPRLNDRYPLTSAYYRALFAGDLGFAVEQTFSRYPTIFGLNFVDDPFRRPGLDNPIDNFPRPTLGYADESFTVYDHPLVIVFVNEERLSLEEMRDRTVGNE